MPKGKASNGDWNFRVKRYLCPSCNRKGLYSTSVYENHSYRQAWVCMYNNCPGRSNHDTFFRKGNDIDVLAANPEIKQSEYNTSYYY